MESRNYLLTGSNQYNQYHNINNQNTSRIFLKDGTILDMNNNSSLNRYGDKSFLRNFENSYSSVSNKDKAKLSKFNSYSARVRYRSNENDGGNGFYVTPIVNAPKRIITVQVPQNQNINLQKDNYHVENVIFQTSPRKYNYKPYKQPKRRNKLKPQYTQNIGGNYYSNYPRYNYNKKY